TTISKSTTTTQYRTTTSPKIPEEVNTTSSAVPSTPQYQTTTSPNSTRATMSSSALTPMKISTTSDALKILTPALFHFVLPIIARLVQAS
uniref:Flocculation protein FLO11-like n=1 Tax=Mesocestoides corti TaxID=53468 RepID=A0A5K3G0Z0_MESCO